MIDTVLQSWRKRPDSEHEQAVIRIGVASAVSLYTLIALRLTDGEISSLLLILLSCFFVVAFAIIVWIIRQPGINIARRILGAVIDNAGTTGMLLLNGDLAAPVFIVYLWVAFGNGFRFGRKFLYFSSTLAIFGFSCVLIFSDLWQISRSLNIGLLVGLFALPLYVGSLLGRLEKALYNAEAANRAKSLFLATMSHEIRTPLNGLIGLLDLLDTSSLPNQQKHYVDLMKKSSEWLLNVISDGLDFTKIESGELVLQPQPVHIREQVQELSAVYREIASTSGVEFIVEFSCLADTTILCDKSRLTQVLNNLLNNACKFTDQGRITFVVSCKEQANQTGLVSFLVQDTGRGIAHESLEEIFSPFKQLQSPAHSVQSGSGLGLAISSRLVSLMGGELTVTSSPGSGSAFSFAIAAPLTAYTPVSADDRSLNPISWKRQPHVLLVEDNEVNREVATAYLKRLGCLPEAVEDGLQAVEACCMKKYDLLLMDCQMPVMDGYEATRKIRSMDDGTHSLAIIALTAHITAQDRERCFEAGMNDYLGKPFKIETLRFILCKWLSHLLATSAAAGHAGSRSDEDLPLDCPISTHDRTSIHDLRNMLSGIIGGLELAMLSVKSPEKSEEYLRTALKSARQAVKISKTL